MPDKNTAFVIAFLLLNVTAGSCRPPKDLPAELVKAGAERTELYIPSLKGKSCAVTTNHTAVIGSVHLVDSLVKSGISVKRIFSPEHGYRGNMADGIDVGNTMDEATGIPVTSLYGQHKKPLPADLQGVDVMIFDMQDVGVRFYTYISTLHYMMEACAENHIPLMVLDRPNPLGHFTDGPVLEPGFESFVGMHPVPVVYGLTIGELSGMINGEGWLGSNMKCDLTVIPCSGYTHQSRYQLPVNPSPGLQSMEAVYLYPSVALFEGTMMNVGRGTPFAFRVFGHPEYKSRSFSYTPQTSEVNRNPKHMGLICYGTDLRKISADSLKNMSSINLSWLMEAYQSMKRPDFFLPYFDKLAGTDALRKQIVSGISEEMIRESWRPGLEKFRQARERYLLYPD